ncbi:phenylalanine--tRNA ligase subunit beta, partial [Candidatus Sumerlaeota bacterium]|nr:phenylalanine--tRNA ligase subunit beta [Candidatus Sumerlaeota bacterium]
DLQTDASFRFERGADRDNVHVALNRAAQIIREVAGGEITKGFVDVAVPRARPIPLTLRISRCDNILGTRLEGSEMADILVSIGCEITHSEHDQLVVISPSHRVDLLREIDLIEEIGRLHGYDKIEATTPYVPARPARATRDREVRQRVASLLLAEGLSEVVTYSFTDRESLERSRQPSDGVVELVNPLSRSQSVLRASLIPSMLATIVHNQKHGVMDLALYELAKSYHWKGGEADPYVERDRAVAALAGCRPTHWGQATAAWDFYDIKGIAERVLESLGIEQYCLERGQRPEFHPSRSAEFKKEGRVLCAFGQINPDVAHSWEVRGDAFIAEFDLAALAACFNPARSFREIPQYPAVKRDLALVVGKEAPAGEIERTLRSAGGELLESLVLFDVYEGKGVPDGKRSLAFSLTFRASDRTLTEDEVNKLQDQLLAAVAKHHSAELRKD